MRSDFVYGDFMREDYMSGDVRGDLNISRFIWFVLTLKISVSIVTHSRFLYGKPRVETLV